MHFAGLFFHINIHYLFWERQKYRSRIDADTGPTSAQLDGWVADLGITSDTVVYHRRKCCFCVSAERVRLVCALDDSCWRLNLDDFTIRGTTYRDGVGILLGLPTNFLPVHGGSGNN